MVETKEKQLDKIKSNELKRKIKVMIAKDRRETRRLFSKPC